jgi:hypothetical protein
MRKLYLITFTALLVLFSAHSVWAETVTPKEKTQDKPSVVHESEDASKEAKTLGEYMVEIIKKVLLDKPKPIDDELIRDDD